METYTQLFARLKAANDSWECIGPQPASRVEEVERKYSIKLPASFREYLIELGGIEFLDAHYTSIDDDYLDDVDGFMCNTNMCDSPPLSDTGGGEIISPQEVRDGSTATAGCFAESSALHG